MTSDNRPDSVARRRFLTTCGKWSMGVLLGAAGYHFATAREGDEAFDSPGYGRLPLTGACAMNLLLDDLYPFRSYAALIGTIMDGIAQERFGTLFVGADLAGRVEVLVAAQEKLPVLRLAYRAIRSAFYGGAYNGLGLDYLSYPGPNLGYRHLPEASLRRPVCQELSETGWLP